MLQVEGLTKHYKTTAAVQDLSFQVRAGEMVGLLGPNGAGKTTVLRCICGIIQPTAGRILINGIDLARDENRAKANLGFVPEVPHPYELLTVREHLEFVARAYRSTQDLVARVDAMLARLDLTDKRDEPVLALSKGMKQKVTIGCALLHEPPLLLLDEPLYGIDPRGQREVKALLQEARAKGQALLVSTHILASAAEVCDRILILNRGRKIAEGGLDDLQEWARLDTMSSLEDVFLALTEEEPGAPADLA